MSSTVRMEIVVPTNRHVELDLPKTFPSGRARITVMPAKEPTLTPRPRNGSSQESKAQDFPTFSVSPNAPPLTPEMVRRAQEDFD